MGTARIHTQRIKDVAKTLFWMHTSYLHDVLTHQKVDWYHVFFHTALLYRIALNHRPNRKIDPIQAYNLKELKLKSTPQCIRLLS